MVCGFLNNFKFSKKFDIFLPHVLLGQDVYAVTDPNYTDQATGAESSNDETDEEAAGSSDEEEEVSPPAPSSGRPRGRRRREPKKKSRVDEVGGEWKKEDNTPLGYGYKVDGFVKVTYVYCFPHVVVAATSSSS